VTEHFYLTTRPFGWWGPFRQRLPKLVRMEWAREHRNDIATVVIALVWQVCLFLLPMQVLTHNGKGIAVTLPLFLAGCVGLYFFWWRNLAAADAPPEALLSPNHEPHRRSRFPESRRISETH
jgi:hypothetical protein